MADKLTPRQRLEAVAIRIAEIEGKRSALRAEEHDLELIKGQTPAQSRRARAVDKQLAALYARLVKLQQQQTKLQREVYGGY